MINDKKISNEDILINKSWMNYRLRLYELDVLLLNSNEFTEKKKYNKIWFRHCLSGLDDFATV